MTGEPTNTPILPVRRYGMIAMAGIAGLALGLLGVYGIAGFGRNATEPECRPAAEAAHRLAPLAHGDVAAVVVDADPHRLPPLRFQDAEGHEKTLADWRGRAVLLNLWATWCIPCRKEMPALDALEAKLGGPAFEVVAVNIDTRDLQKPKTWLKDVGINRLGYFADPDAKVFQELKAVGKAIGMPTTLLVDLSGCAIASLAGPAEWASDDGIRLVQAAIGEGRAE